MGSSSSSDCSGISPFFGVFFLGFFVDGCWVSSFSIDSSSTSISSPFSLIVF
jgi:hypothetical protein